MSDIPQPLLDDINSERCLPFIGAGFSLNAQLPSGKRMPDWPALTESLAIAANVSPQQDGPTVALAYERLFGRVQLIEKIRDLLHADWVEPGEAHREFANLPFDTIYTTNFDLLLEEANRLIRKPYRPLVGDFQLPFHGGPLTTNIVKMHGDMHHQEHMIITEKDYSQFLEHYPVISTHLSSMLITRTALFVGYSLRDPDFNHIRDVVSSRLGKFQRMSYTIQFDLSAEEIEKMREENLHVINLRLHRDQSRAAALSDFFRCVQRELDAQTGSRIRVATPEVFEDIPQDKIEETSRSPDASMLLSSSSNLCFVITPFEEMFNDIYRTAIVPAVQQVGLDAMRADQLSVYGSVMEHIRSAIQQARLCIAILTSRNRHVIYELGIAHTSDKPLILLTHDMNDIPFDILQYQYPIVQYGIQDTDLERLRVEIVSSIMKILGPDRLNEAQDLIKSGSVRAGCLPSWVFS